MPKYVCKVGSCIWAADEDLPIHVSGCLTTWHVYEDHPEIWLEQIGNRPPNDPDPRTDEGMAIAILQQIEIDMKV